LHFSENYDIIFIENRKGYINMRHVPSLDYNDIVDDNDEIIIDDDYCDDDDEFDDEDVEYYE
jgi:hypothetical protein